MESGDWKIKYFLSLYQKEKKKYKEYFEVVQTQVPKPNRSSKIVFLGTAPPFPNQRQGKSLFSILTSFVTPSKLLAPISSCKLS